MYIFVIGHVPYLMLLLYNSRLNRILSILIEEYAEGIDCNCVLLLCSCLWHLWLVLKYEVFCFFFLGVRTEKMLLVEWDTVSWWDAVLPIGREMQTIPGTGGACFQREHGDFNPEYAQIAWSVGWRVWPWRTHTVGAAFCPLVGKI